MSDQIRVVNFIEVQGMPGDPEAANRAAWDSVQVTNLHIKEAGRYFIARVTEIKAVGCESVRRLDPDDQADIERIAEMMPVVAKAMDWPPSAHDS